MKETSYDLSKKLLLFLEQQHLCNFKFCEIELLSVLSFESWVPSGFSYKFLEWQENKVCDYCCLMRDFPFFALQHYAESFLKSDFCCVL